MTNSPPIVLVADDDSDDLCLTLEALAEVPVTAVTYSVADGIELLDRLQGNGEYAGARPSTEERVALLKSIAEYWFRTVRLPKADAA